MNHLVDTNAWIAFFQGSPGLSEDAAGLMESGAPCFLSIASVWEAAIKCGLGKLKLPYDLETDLPGIVDRCGFRWLPIEVEDAAGVRHLKRIHGDPFDRLMAVQARRRKWRVISRDPVFDRYGLKRVW